MYLRRDSPGAVQSLHVLQHDDEFVGAPARYGVGLTDDGLQPRRHVLEHVVRAAVPQQMVEIGEAVDVDVQQRDPPAAALGARQGLSEAVAEQGTIREPGQRVVKGESLDELLRALTLGHVHDDPDAAAYPLRRVEQRCRADRDPLLVAAWAQTELSLIDPQLPTPRRLADGGEVRLAQVTQVGADDALFRRVQE